MLKLIRYLKPHSALVMLCVLIVFGQAMCDLKLPDYMADIVDIGVQRYGVESMSAMAISPRTFDRLMLLLSDSERETVRAHYALLTPGAPSYDALLAKNPDLTGELYILQDVAAESADALDAALEKGMLAIAALTSPELGLVPEGVDPFAALAAMPEPQRAELLASSGGMMENMGDSVMLQAASLAIHAEYESIGIDTAALQTSVILKTGGKMLLVALMGVLLSVSAGFLSSRIGTSAAKAIRTDVFKKAVSFSNHEFDRFSTASLITRTTNDVQQVQMIFIMTLRMVIFAPSMGIGGIIYALQKSVSMSWIIALAVIVIFSIVGVMFTIALPRFKTLQKLVDRLNLVTRENLSGIMVSKAYNAQAFEQKRFDEASGALARLNLFVTRVMGGMMPLMTLLMNGISLLIIWVGAHQVVESGLQIGAMMAYMQYAMQVIMSFLMVSMLFIMLPRAAVSGERISEVLQSESAIRDPAQPKRIDPASGDYGQVEFINVDFRFPGAEEDTLKGLTFTAKPGQTTAIIGSTGAGKTTLINLIMRFYDATAGRVLVSGVDVREAAQDDVRGQIGLVPQKAVLFTGTIGENIAFGGQDIPQARVEQSAATAQAMEFIRAKAHQFDEVMAQGGVNVSGGQRQRLAIARALATDAPIYVFDDSFSALDFKTDAALRRALHESAAEKTLIIVAQRVGTIKNADQIIVLENGQIVGKGTHSELLAHCETYLEIARSQLREEEIG